MKKRWSLFVMPHKPVQSEKLFALVRREPGTEDKLSPFKHSQQWNANNLCRAFEQVGMDPFEAARLVKELDAGKERYITMDLDDGQLRVLGFPDV